MTTIQTRVPGRLFRRNAARLLSAAALLVTTAGITTAAELYADVVYTNGNIYTLDAESSTATAVAVRDGRFIAVGEDADVEAFVGPETETIDLEGNTVVPGLNDNHNHTVSAGEAASRVPLEDVTTVAEALERIKTFVDQSEPGEWIIGGSIHQASQLEEQRYITAAELDTVAPNNPVRLPGKVSSYNTMAMELAGIDRDTPDPEFGVIERDAEGNATGVFQQEANSLITPLIPDPTVDQYVEYYREAMKVANSYGLTSVTEPSTQADKIEALQRLMENGELTLRYSVMYGLSASLSPEQMDNATGALGLSSGFGNEWLRLDAIGEMAIDGGMTFRTAYMREPYPDDPEYYGIPLMFEEQLNSLVSVANKNGWRFSIHQVGDAATDLVLDAYEAADAERSIADRRFAVMHGSLIQEDQLERMAELGVIWQPQSVFMWDKAATVEENLGTETANRAIPLRSGIDILGINNVALGSDYSTNLMNPWIGISVAVTRTDPEGTVYGADQAITREEALRLYTISGAYSTFEEDIKGPIEVGMLADMAVIDRDYFTVDEEEIKDIVTLKTIVGGKVVYESE